MSVAGSIYLTGGWTILAFQPGREWVALILFGLGLVAITVDRYAPKEPQ